MTNPLPSAFREVHALLLSLSQDFSKKNLDALRRWYPKARDITEAADDYTVCHISLNNIAAFSTWVSLFIALECHFVFEDPSPEDVHELLSDLEAYWNNSQTPLEIRNFSDEERHDILTELRTDSSLNALTDEEVAIFRALAEASCQAKERLGLEIVGYGSYGGNRAFPSDFSLAETCMLTLLEEVSDYESQGMYANTLGYIYYYGRTSNGVPQYDKAYRYFSFAAQCGITEAQYKLSDLLDNGYGCVKSPSLARSILHRLYNESVHLLARGIADSKFADIALRLGRNALSYTEDLSPADRDRQLRRALAYFTEAEFAIRVRRAVGEYYGDRDVAKTIEGYLSEVKAKLGFRSCKRYTFDTFYPMCRILRLNLYPGQAMRCTVDEIGENSYRLSFRLVKERNRAARRLFLSFPQLSYCGFYDRFSVTVLTDDALKPGDFIFDDIDEDAVFCYGGSPIYSLPLYAPYTVKAPRTPKTLRIVSAESGQGEEEYLCEDAGISDLINIVSEKETTVARVVRISLRDENTLPLPLKAYPKATLYSE